MPVKPYIAKHKIAYIFVMTQLQREELKALFWDNASARAVEIQECFKNDLRYDDVQILTDLSKE